MKRLDLNNLRKSDNYRGGRGNCVLSCNAIYDIFIDFIDNRQSMEFLAKKYSVSRTTIQRILYRERYKHCTIPTKYIKVDIKKLAKENITRKDFNYA